MTTMCSSGKTPFFSFIIVKDDEQNKYVAKVIELKRESEEKSFNNYYKAREWVTKKINVYYRDTDEVI